MKPSKTKYHSQITQALLEEFWSNRLEMAELRRDNTQLRQTLLTQSDAGYEVEPGSLSLRIISREQRSLTRTRLVGMLGKKWVDELVANVEPRIVRRVYVETKKDKPGGLWLPDDSWADW